MNIELGEVQAAFADIIWTNEPVGSGELVKICERELKWKKPTTYTVLRKLCEKGLFKNEDGVVTSVISREEFNASKSEKFIEETFDGSLPAFIAAFISQKKLSKKEADEIQKMCRIFLIAVTTTLFTPIAADAFPKTVTIVLTGMTFPGISGIFNNSCAIYFLRDGGRVFVYDRRNGAECTSLYQFLVNINSFSQC